jgi:CelD/BcsL family acetyltransferase involved in cellulose biosynthesis
LRCEFVEERERISPHEPAWEALAVACARPFCLPAWLLAWWDQAAPPRSRLAVALVFDGDDLVGVGPWFVHVGRGGFNRYQPLGTGTFARVVPLSAPGREAAVATALAQALSTADIAPDLVMFEGVEEGCAWPELLCDAWPRSRPWVGRTIGQVAPFVTVDGRDFENWFATKTAHFRKRMRRSQKEFAKHGGTYRLTTPDRVKEDVRRFAALHRARWQGRGGSGVLTPGAEAMLVEAGERLAGSGRFRLWTMEVGGEAISSHLALEAGGEVGYWLTGFDERHARYSPSRLGILHVIKDSCELGAARVDLGDGEFAFKLRFTDGAERLQRLGLAPRGRRYPLRRLVMLRLQLRRVASERLPEGAKARVRALKRRGG